MPVAPTYYYITTRTNSQREREREERGGEESRARRERTCTNAEKARKKEERGNLEFAVFRATKRRERERGGVGGGRPLFFFISFHPCIGH